MSNEIQKKFTDSFNTLSGCKVEEVKKIEKDFDVRCVFETEEDGPFNESFFFSVDKSGNITRHDFGGSSDWWGNIKDLDETVQRAFKNGAHWMSSKFPELQGF